MDQQIVAAIIYQSEDNPAFTLKLWHYAEPGQLFEWEVMRWLSLTMVRNTDLNMNSNYSELHYIVFLHWSYVINFTVEKNKDVCFM